MVACEIQCYHCGEDCETEAIKVQEKHFCCDGCKMVYELLSENNLDAYYQLESRPGNAVRQENSKEQYAYLDLPEVQEALLNFREEGCSKITITIPSIHCSSCVYLLENLPRINPAIEQVLVDFVRREAAITFDDRRLSLRALVELLVKIGYTPDLTPNKTSKKKSINRKLYLKIGLAGFCFGNIMLLSFPEYFIVNENDLVNYKTFFGWLNFLLALPVLLYCAQDYLKSALASLQQKMIGIDVPIALGIIALFTRSSYEIFTQTGAGYMDSFAGLIFFLLIGKWYQNRTYESLSFERDYTAYFPIATTKVNSDGSEKQVLIEQLKVGDVIKIRNQEIIPTDSILKSKEASIDYSFVSGESIAISKKEGDKLYAGGRQIGHVITLEVLQEVNQSYFTQLWNQPVFQEEKTAVLSKTVDAISRYFTISILSIAMLTLLYWLWVDASIALLSFSAVLIIACPCALALSAPFAFGNVLRLFGQKGLFLKNALAVEQLAEVTDVIFDKTGTLTTNDVANVQFVGETLSEIHYQQIYALVQNSTHPLSQMLAKYIQGLDFVDTQKDFPIKAFVETSGQGIEAWIDDHFLEVGSSKFVGKSAYQMEGLTTAVYVAIDHYCLGYFIIKKEYRKNIETVLENLSKDFTLHLLSGDNDADRAYLQHLFPAHESLHFQQTPVDKLNYVKILQQTGKKVLMIGDGLNDAGALQQADVGIAVANDVHSFSPASDGILEASKISNLNHYTTVAQRTLSVVKASFILSLLYNSVGLFFAVQGLLTPVIAAILMPLSSISIIIFTTILTNWIARR
ncbi:heavy metal translocating P-type ATPase metal-binding domain-containing protein [Aureispira sp. CCB-E]|uniref:heavy metal translocating P-type ATPase n=1 Tax=Aureispira sp. CCB-E TaxID=3051121 RepID=UPI002868A8C4|nr:heavy metal translocating P-type ATPase metal-binding domain-containing protein [Aureispira sp. CCB-E]WMX13993.1 heavy metal translocating P-type ATPase metal-binding domain-containing protein [Aureispira sp. CCB-E]